MMGNTVSPARNAISGSIASVLGSPKMKRKSPNSISSAVIASAA